MSRHFWCFEDVKRELLGDAELLSEDQVASLFLLTPDGSYKG